MKNGMGESSKWLWGNLIKCVENEGNTFFWDSVWVGNTPLKTRFPRLYHLSE